MKGAEREIADRLDAVHARTQSIRREVASRAAEAYSERDARALIPPTGGEGAAEPDAERTAAP